MKNIIHLWLIVVIALVSISSHAFEQQPKDRFMKATGIFEVSLTPQNDSDAPAGRMLINKNYSGDFVGTGIGQMLSKRVESGAAAYSAVEEVAGDLAGKSGSFTLIHQGFMSAQTQQLDIYILQGSGKGELANISGTLEIVKDGDIHKYVLNYQL